LCLFLHIHRSFVIATTRKHIPGNIIISRTDSIGDTILTLPVAGVLKEVFPKIKIAFLGKAYTRPVIETCKWIDEFIDAQDFMNRPVTIAGQPPEAILHVFPVAAIARRAKSIGIPIRIGTTNRIYHWTTCTELVKLSRKHSDLHESQLNLKLLEPLGITRDFSLAETGALIGMDRLRPLPPSFAALIRPDRYNLILHPRSQGSAREWGLLNFIKLIRLLDHNRYRIFISGTKKERATLQPLFDEVGDSVTDIMGQMNLDEFISFIGGCDGLVANSTGPLHIAAALGRDAMGIYPSMRPIHPGRWAPLGPGVRVFVLDKDCSACRNIRVPCQCIMDVNPLLISEALEKASALSQKTILE
jgi:heptosyltransferase III